MRRFPFSIFPISLALFFLVLLHLIISEPASAGELRKFSGVTLVSNSSNDGDSFLVKLDGKEQRVRIYFVDCPETGVTSDGDAQRLREQARYFGLVSTARATHFGLQAKAFTEKALARPFTVHTDFASALGRSAGGRIYVFVTTAEGRDLAGLLVEKGLARPFGEKRDAPDGMTQEAFGEKLQGLEAAAMLKRAGAWAESDPDKIAELRAKQREEKLELKKLQGEIKASQAPTDILDLNSAGQAELENLPGIGPTLAARIISGRPYRKVDDLLRVKGISDALMKKISPWLTVGQKR